MFETAGYDAAIVDHDTPGGFGPEATAGGAHVFVETTGWDVPVDGSQDSGLGWAGPLCRPSRGDPVDLASRVVIRLLEAQLFESPRGSGAHVSKGIPAIDRYRLRGFEECSGLGAKLFEGNVNGSGKMFLGVFVSGENLYELSPAIEELAKLITVDRPGHDWPLSVHPPYRRVIRRSWLYPFGGPHDQIDPSA
jgi:hypothetical protein